VPARRQSTDQVGEGQQRFSTFFFIPFLLRLILYYFLIFLKYRKICYMLKKHALFHVVFIE